MTEQKTAVQFIPHGYQRVAIDKVKNTKDVALLLDCGLGKTMITLKAIVEMGLHNILIVAPKQVVENVWEQEAAKWTDTRDLTFSKILGTPAQRLKALNTPADIYLISRDNITWLRGLNHPKANLNTFQMIVLDESSSFKNPTAARTEALYDFDVPKKVLLTATPMPKHLLDLFSQFKIMDCGRMLGTDYFAFKTTFFANHNPHFPDWKPKKGAEEAIYNRIAPVTLSMKNRDLLKLPELVKADNVVYFTLEERALYDSLREDAVIKIIDEAEGDEEKIIQAVNKGVLQGKLRQLANGFLYDTNELTGETSVIDISKSKIHALESILEACSGETVLVAYQFKHDLELLNKMAEEMKLNYCNLSDPNGMMKYENGVDVAFLHPRSSGFGLNLQSKSHRLVWYALPWSYEEYEQTCARVYRQGQKNTTYIHTIVADDTVDNDIIDALAYKGGFNERLKACTLAYLKMANGAILLNRVNTDHTL